MKKKKKFFCSHFDYLKYWSKKKKGKILLCKTLDTSFAIIFTRITSNLSGFLHIIILDCLFHENTDVLCMKFETIFLYFSLYKDFFTGARKIRMRSRLFWAFKEARNIRMKIFSNGPDFRAPTVPNKEFRYLPQISPCWSLPNHYSQKSSQIDLALLTKSTNPSEILSANLHHKQPSQDFPFKIFNRKFWFSKLYNAKLFLMEGITPMNMRI